MVVGYRQYLCLLAITPLRLLAELALWAVPVAAGMVLLCRVAAVITLQLQSSHHGGSTSLNMFTDFAFLQAEWLIIQ